MKVLLLNDIMLKGGKERRIVELMRYFKNTYPEVTFEVILMHDTINYPEINDFGFKINVLKWTNRTALQGFKKIFKIVDEFKPDVIHSWSSMTDVVATVLRGRRGYRFISSMVAQAIPRKTLKDKDYRRSILTFPAADIITSNSKAGLVSYGAPQAKSVCIYNGFNTARLNNLLPKDELKRKLGIEGKFVIGMVAAFERRKDYATIIEAAKTLLQKHGDRLVFLLIGDGSLKEEMVNKAGEEYNKGIVFTGKLNNVESYINIFDAGVLCTNSEVHGEGISNAILEYMALGKPVIATEGGGTNEIVFNNQTGYLVPPGRPAVVVEKIERILNNPSEANSLAASAQKRVKEVFTIENMGSSFYNVYKELAAKRKA